MKKKKKGANQIEKWDVLLFQSELLAEGAKGWRRIYGGGKTRKGRRGPVQAYRDKKPGEKKAD